MAGGKGVALLDTDVASFMLKKLPLGAEYTDLVRGYDLRLSFATATELHFWANRNKLGPRRRLHLDLFLTWCPVVPYGVGMEQLFAKVMYERERIGKPMGYADADAWTATTALFHGLPLATHDTDFLDTRGLRVITASAKVRANHLLLDAAQARPPMLLDMRCRCSL
jgi:predicted nucleic acid-binding protein